MRLELLAAKRHWGRLPQNCLERLRELLEQYRFSIRRGDVQLLDGHWYVTHAGLLRLAQRRHCAGIHSSLERQLSDPALQRWIFKAVVFRSAQSRGFVGYGDADPSNVSAFARGAEMRIAETRAVNRALRKAYGIGLCSIEELGVQSEKPTGNGKEESSHKYARNGAGNGPRLRDRLCVLIRQYGLNPELVKAYAADFCGAPSLREARRESVASFVSHIAESAKENREALVAKLNSYAQAREART